MKKSEPEASKTDPKGSGTESKELELKRADPKEKVEGVTVREFVQSPNTALELEDGNRG